MPCSAFARLLFIGLGVEADDKGTFEWKPVTIKMSVFPGDNVDVEALLDELVEAEAIRKYEIEGRQYGAIRNFRKFQKPKTPNDVHPCTEEIRNYVGLTPSISETTPVERGQFLRKGEKSFQMEDGGGKREEGKGEKKDRGADAPATEFAFVGRTIRLKTADFERWRKAYSKIPDMVAELTKADDFYTENPPKSGKWYFPLSKWLERANAQVITAATVGTGGKLYPDKHGNLPGDPYYGADY